MPVATRRASRPTTSARQLAIVTAWPRLSNRRALRLSGSGRIGETGGTLRRRIRPSEPSSERGSTSVMSAP